MCKEWANDNNTSIFSINSLDSFSNIFKQTKFCDILHNVKMMQIKGKYWEIYLFEFI